MQNTENGDTSFKSQLTSRFYLLSEILIILVFNFIFFYIFYMVIGPSLSNGSEFDIIIIYLEYLFSILLGSFVGLYIIKAIFTDKVINPLPDDISPFQDIISLFTIKKSNFRYQVMYSILLLFLIFIPLDFLAYSIPGVMQFSVNSLLGDSPVTSINRYLTFTDFLKFIGFATIVHFCVGFREELFFRGINVTRGRKHIGNYPAVIVFSISFGLAHFAYLFNSNNLTTDFFPALIWGVSAFLVGTVSALFIMQKRYIWPLIIAHSVNNILSSIALWQFIQGQEYTTIALILYLPLLIISFIVVVIFRSKIKSGLKKFGKLFPEYWKSIGKTKVHCLLITLIDIGLSIILWLVGFYMF
ncbi:MAG: lysostaphin resistance A-like protein [Promethearchaeota archaeon]